jgi:lipopolysaccharide biosynthesis protein
MSLHGFCYYHYWFCGKRLLEQPFNEVLASGEPDFPFCLCWANEPWSRRWDGSEHEILMPQSYSVEDDREHLRWLARAFSDRRYIRVDGKPLFLVYRGSDLPDPARTTETWREEARRLGIGELFLCRVESFPAEITVEPRASGFDAAVEFMPAWWEDMGPRLKFYGRRWRWARRLGLVSEAYARHKVHDYATLAARAMAKPLPPYEMFRCVTPGWDNTARRASDALILDGSMPEFYEQWLSFVLRQAKAQSPDLRIVFINAWNEWGEGCYLEPDAQFGRGYLEATSAALSGQSTRSTQPRPEGV